MFYFMFCWPCIPV